MKRTAAKSVWEICERHHCTALVPDGAVLPVLPPYAALTVVAREVGIGESLRAAIANVRQDYEIVEMYTRVGGSVFEPFVEDRFAACGDWVIVARQRHPSHSLRVVGIMLAKDEADVIPDVLRNISRTCQTLYFYAPDDDTKSALLMHGPFQGWARALPGPAEGVPYTDGYRQVLLQQARADAEAENDLRPMWVMVVQGDEIYHDDLRARIDRAHADRATVINCHQATFLLHESQRVGWDWTKQIESRLTHYFWDYIHHAGFLDFPWIYYEISQHMNAHPKGYGVPGKWVAASGRPMRKHYPFRTPEQARARIEDRLKSGWQTHYEYYKNVFMGDQVAGRPIKVFSGSFSEAEQI